VCVTLLAAAGWIFSKEALFGLPPLLFIGSRFLIAGLVLAAFGWKPLMALGRRGLLRTALVGVSFGFAMIFWILGLNYANHIGVGAFITSLGVILVPVVALFFGDKPTKAVWMSLPFALAGLAALSLDSHFVIGFGEVAFLLAAALFAVTFNLNSRAAAKTSPVALAAVQLVVVGLVALPVSFVLETWTLDVANSIWWWFFASIFIATSLRFFMQTWAQSLSSASNAAVIMTLEPVWTAMLAAVWFSETMSGMQLLGCMLIFSALLVSRWRSVRQVLRALCK